MTKNKGLNLLFTVVEVAVLALIVNFIDLAASSNGAFILGTIFSGLIWIAFWIYKVLLDDPFHSVARIAKNAALIAMIGIGAIALILAAFSFFSDGTATFVGSTTLISTALMLALALYSCTRNGEFFIEHTLFIPAGVAVASMAVSTIFWLMPGVAIFLGIILIVVCVGLIVIAFKQGWVEFISIKAPKVTLSTSHDDDDEKKDENTLDPNKAMKNLARKFSKKHYNIVLAGIDMYPHVEYEGIRNGNTAYFNVVVEVRWWGTPNTGKINWERVYDDRLQTAWNEFTKEMMRAHELEVARLRAAGVNCSSIMSIGINPVETKTTTRRYTN